MRSTIALTTVMLGAFLLGGSVTGAAPDDASQYERRLAHVQATTAEIVRILEEIGSDTSYGGTHTKILCLACMLAYPDEPEMCTEWCEPDP